MRKPNKEFEKAMRIAIKNGVKIIKGFKLPERVRLAPTKDDLAEMANLLDDYAEAGCRADGTVSINFNDLMMIRRIIKNGQVKEEAGTQAVSDNAV